jgi:hypothetical protein
MKYIRPKISQLANRSIESLTTTSLASVRGGGGIVGWPTASTNTPQTDAVAPSGFICSE